MTERVDSHQTAGDSVSKSAPERLPRLASDDRLAKRATKGDQRAFEEIYRRYHQSLYRFCVAMVGNPQDAQDALQNTMIKVLRALPGEKRDIKLKPWLYRIARNEAIETVRRRRDSTDIDAEQTSSPGELAETVEARDRLRKLIGDLDELPERQRAALVMRELAGFDFAQIGATFETSAAVARQTVYEARLGLRQMEEGREMSCESVMRELSDADGRLVRRRAVKAHLRGCQSCRDFRDSIHARRSELAAIAPLPLAASAGLLHGILGGSASAAAGAGAAGGAGGSLAGTTLAAGGKAVATSAIVKSAATVAVVAAVGVSAADRSGVIDVPLPGGIGSGSARSDSNRQPEGKLNATRAGAAHGNANGVTTRGDRNQDGATDGAGSANGLHGRAGANGKRSVAGRHAGRSSGSHTLGHGHGKGHGRPDALPESSAYGQQTATAHKSPNANPSPGVPRSSGKSAPESAAPPPTSSPRPHGSPEAPPAPPEAPTESPSEGEGPAKGNNGLGGHTAEP